MNTQYSFVKTLEKGLVAFAIFAIPFLVSQFPAVANLTIGGIAVMAMNFLKNKYGL